MSDPYLRGVPDDSSDVPPFQPGPSHGPPPAPAHPQAQPPLYVQVRTVPTSGLAVAGFVISLLGIPFVGLIMCFCSLGDTGRGVRGGHGLAIAGIIIGGLYSLGWAIFILIGVFVVGGSWMSMISSAGR